MENSVIEELGLTRNESEIYLSLLKNGMSSAGDLTKDTGIHRRNVYDSLQRLMQKGLASSIKESNHTLFNPANPKRFYQLIEERRSALESKKDQLDAIMPALLDMRSARPKHDVRFFTGIEGLKTVFEDILRTNKDYLGYGPGNTIESLMKFYFPQFIKKRKRLKIKHRMIYDEKSRGAAFTRGPLSRVRYLPNKYISLTANRIYGDKVSILLISQTEPMAITIKNKEIALSYRKHFEILWKGASE